MDYKYNIDPLLNGLKEFNIELSDVQIEQFISYYDFLVEWNSFMNLTAITEWNDVITKHFVDSVSLIKCVNNMTDASYYILDVGTGAGFPGIPLKIVFPNLRIVLLDSLNKRVKFLNHVIDTLKLDDIIAIHGRAEELAKDKKYREQFDFVVSRAVANMTVLSEFCLPFVKISGSFISYKSEKINTEIDEAKNAIKILGGEFSSHIDFNLPYSDFFRSLVVINKVTSTPNKYPRKAGTPAKEPL